MLNDGVAENQRVACFHLAANFSRLGFPYDIAVAALERWATKNHPASGKRIITDAEIERQAADAYKRNQRACGCESSAVRPFCAPECPLYERVRFHIETRTGPEK